MNAAKRHHSISAGTYSDADPNSAQQSFSMSHDGSRPGYMRFGKLMNGRGKRVSVLFLSICEFSLHRLVYGIMQ